MAQRPPPSPQQIADRLSGHSRLLYERCIIRARSLWEIWQSYNDAQNPLRDADVRYDGSSTIINLLAQSAMHETIMIITRALDGPGRNLFTTNRVSFPVMAELVRQPGVLDELEQRARNWHDGFNADESARTCRNELALMEAGVERLQAEEPSRHQRLRSFRDEFLAHNLTFEEERERPIIGDVTGILNELTELSNQTELAINGANVIWEPLEADIRQRADALWQRVRGEG